MKTRTAILLAGLALALGLAAPAGATTFCVPDFHAACPDDGANVATIDLETAMQTNASDGQPDRAVIAPGTYTDSDAFETTGSDDLEIVGAGPDQTKLTSSSTGNIFVVNLGLGARDVTMRDLTIVIPASFQDSGGAALQASDDTVENVDIQSLNPESTGISFSEGGTFRDGTLEGSGPGSFGTAINTNTLLTGALTIEGAEIREADEGIWAQGPGWNVSVSRTLIEDTEIAAVMVTNGAIASLVNSAIDTENGSALRAQANTSVGVSLTARHTSIARSDVDPDPALRALVPNAPKLGSAFIGLYDSIVHGYEQTYERSAPSAMGIGSANITLRYSMFEPVGTSTGDGTLDVATGNSDANPHWLAANDFHLQPDSPAIDAGDPLSAGLATEDFDGLLRPADGNGDGTFRRDMGAFEFQPPTPPTPNPADPGDPAPGNNAPSDPAPTGPAGAESTGPARITSLRLSRRTFRARRGVTVRYRMSRAARVRLTVQRRVRNRRTHRIRWIAVRGSIRLAGRTGANRLRFRGRLGGRVLRPGAYRLVLTPAATGGRSGIARRAAFRVRR